MMSATEKMSFVQNLLVALVVGVLGWNIYSTQQLTVQQAVVASKLEHLVNRGELDVLRIEIRNLDDRVKVLERK